MDNQLNKGTITIDEFISAIAIGCPFQYSYEQYINELITLSPRSQNPLWINFCKILKKSDELPVRAWRVWAHNLFISQHDEIEKEFMRRTHYMNDSANSATIVKFLCAAAQDKVMTEHELDSVLEYLHIRGYLDSEDDIRDNDSASQSGAEGPSRPSVGEVPGTSGQVAHNQDNENAASNNPREKGQCSIDVDQVGPEKLSKIMRHLYKMTGLALACDKISSHKKCLKNSKVPGVPKETRSQPSASTVIRPTKGSSKTVIIPTILSTISRINESSDRSDNLIPSITVTDFDAKKEKEKDGKTDEASSKSQDKKSAPSKS